MMNDDAGPKGQRKKLLFFASERTEASILRAYRAYLKQLEELDCFDITIMAPNASPFANEVRLNGHYFHPLSEFSKKLLLRTPQLWPILTATRRYRFDVAVCHDAYACRGIGLISKRVVGVCHDDQLEGFGAADQVIVLSSSTADMAQDMLEDTPVSILPYAYVCQFDAMKPLASEDNLTIGMNSEFIKGDGTGTFIHTAQLLHQSCPEAQIVIAGTGPEEQPLKELADKIAPFIDFAGPMTTAEMAQRFDIYCCVEPIIAHSQTLYEMMDAGLACIATFANGPIDILRGGMVGPLTPASDAFQLAVQLQELLEDHGHINRIKRACFERIREEDFDKEILQKRLLSVLNNDEMH